MSDGMEREKNERLTAREIEEEEMKRELTGIGIYEPEFTYKQMKRLLEFVNESPDTSNATSNNKNAQEETQHSDDECLSDVTSNVNVEQDVTLQECTEMPRPSYSYKQNRASPTMHERKSIHYINNLESPSLFEARNPTYRRKSSDSDDLFEKSYDNANSMQSANRYFSLRSGNVSRESQNAAQERRTAQDAQGGVVQKLERWRLNPLEVSINENDVPLRQPNRSSARERVPFEQCKEAPMSDQCDQVIRSMSQHLKDMADLWYKWRPITNQIFQWGSPIQVGAANGSLDKKTLTDPKTEQITAECTYRDGYMRASKRKANTFIANLNKDSSSEDEDGSRNDFVCVKKKRAQSDDKSNSVASNNAASQHAHTNRKKTTSNVITYFCSDDNSDTDIGSERVKHLPTKTDEKDERASPDLNAYPRRITPPNPKKHLNLPRQKRGNAISKSSSKTRRNGNKVVGQAKDEKKNNTLTEEEIRKLIDTNEEEEEDITMERDVEIRPLPISKEVRSKIREKRLSKSRIAKETQTAVKKEGSDEEWNNEKRAKLSKQQKEEESCKMENRNGSWTSILSDDEDNKSSEMNQEFVAQNDNQSDNVPTSTRNVSCPICNKWFPHNEIENHAAYCDQFETNNEKDNNGTGQLECNICSNYKTNNGVEYEEHVQQCINKNDKRHSHGNKVSCLF